MNFFGLQFSLDFFPFICLLSHDDFRQLLLLMSPLILHTTHMASFCFSTPSLNRRHERLVFTMVSWCFVPNDVSGTACTASLRRSDKTLWRTVVAVGAQPKHAHTMPVDDMIWRELVLSFWVHNMAPAPTQNTRNFFISHFQYSDFRVSYHCVRHMHKHIAY